MLRVLIFLVSLGARAIRAMCRRRADLVIENLALRQQVTALKKERPRPPLENGPALSIIAKNSLEDGFDASPAIVDDELYLRGYRHLYRISVE